MDKVIFGFYSPGGGTSGQIYMRWHDLSRPYIEGEVHIAPRLEVFSDGWHALWQFRDVLEALAELDDVDITPKEFCQLLDEHGFIDATPREEKKGRQP